MKAGTYQLDTNTITVSASIEDVGIREQWEAGSIKVSDLTYLSFLERTRPENIEFYYVIVSNRSGDICAKLYLQNIRFGSKNVVPDKGLVVCAAVAAFLTVRPFHILVCGNVFAVNFPALAFDSKAISQDELLNVLHFLEENIKCDAIVLKDLPSIYTNEKMLPLGYQDYLADLTMSLDILPHWKSLEDYQNDLSKKYRKRMQHIRDAAKVVVRKELSEKDIQSLRKELWSLVKAVSSRQTIQMCEINEEYFPEMKKTYPSTFKVYGYFLAGKLIGFTSFIDRDHELEFHYIGIDYAFNQSHSLYFNMLFDGLENAINVGKKELELGRTAREAKANLGCRPVYFNDFIRIKSKTAKLLADWIGGRFQTAMGEDWKNRHPFKQAKV